MTIYDEITEALRKRDERIQKLEEALSPFAVHVSDCEVAFPRDPVSARDVCRGSVSFRDFQNARNILESKS